MNKQVTTAITLDTRRKRQDGTFPVRLRVTFDRKRKYYGTKFKLTEEDFGEDRGSQAQGGIQGIKTGSLRHPRESR